MRTTNGTNGNGYIRTVTPREGYRLLDKLTKQHYGLTAGEFIDAWQAGGFRDEYEYPDAVRLAMMIPLAG